MTAIDAEQFSLRWNNFHNNLTAGFHDLLLGEDLVDVTIAAEGKFVQAHKMVLSVCSPYFKNLFKVNPCKHPIVILKDTGYKELEALLQFMYRGEVNVRQEELAMFLKTAEMLQIKGLTGSDSKKESAEPSSNRPSSNSAPSRTHSLPQDTSTHPPPKRKRSEVPPLPSTSAPNTPTQVVDVTPQTPPEGPSNDQALQDGNDFINMMNPKLEPQEYDESEDGLDMMADDSVGHDPLVQQLLGGADPKGMAGLGNFVGLPGMKDGNVGQDGGQDAAPQVTTININTSSSAPAYDVLRGPGPGLRLGPEAPGGGAAAGTATRGGRALARAGGGGGGADMAYQCSRCPKRFATQSNLRRHYLNLHGPDRGPFLCPFCGKLTKNKISLKSHIYAYHKLHGGAAGAGAPPAQAQQWPDTGAANQPD